MKRTNEFFFTNLSPRDVGSNNKVTFNKIAAHNRNLMIAEIQIKRIKEEEKLLFQLIEQYRNLLDSIPRNYNHILSLEYKIDLIAEDYCKSKIYIHCL